MRIEKLPAGPKGKVPNVIYVFVEVPKGSNIKHEVDEKSGTLIVNRILFTAYVYPGDYGFIPQTLGEDGDHLDCLVLVNEPSYPGTVLPARPISVIRVRDENGRDDKILAVPAERVDPRFKEIKDLKDVPTHYKKELKNFFEHMKELEPGKWLKVERFENAEAAKKTIIEAMEAYKKFKK